MFLFSLFFFFFSFACSLHLRSCSLSPLVVFAALRFCRKKIEQEEGMVVDRLLLLLERGGDVVGVVVGSGALITRDYVWEIRTFLFLGKDSP